MKEKIHALSEEMVANLGRLVAIVVMQRWEKETKLLVSPDILILYL